VLGPRFFCQLLGIFRIISNQDIVKQGTGFHLKNYTSCLSEFNLHGKITVPKKEKSKHNNLPQFNANMLQIGVDMEIWVILELCLH
jgi:hypothetical protein